MSRKQRLLVVLVLNLALVAGLVTAGVTAHSLAVLAEGGDYLLDAAGVGVALLAVRLSARPGSPARSQGHPHATSVAALVNGGWLLVLELLVASAAVDRLLTGTPQVDGLPVLVMSSIAALVMTAGALVLRADGDDGDGETGERDLSVAAVLLDTVADAAAAAGVAATGGIILAAGGWYWLDPAVALAIAVVVAFHALALIRKVITRLRPAAAGTMG
ncbi:MAG TPA: cation diffusion facilitator family transporter [Streptosporangiaceae bacterium]|nr:cation diffusion facilitator family transporter [Streptosporangiaceae bacterium]